jgi:hypothetical protein
MMRFTWIDCETGESDVNEFGANGQNDWEKGLGSALTYAERYFLLKFFHIATDEDDIDNADRKTSAGVPLETAIREAKTLAELTNIYTKYKPTDKNLLDLMSAKKTEFTLNK